MSLQQRTALLSVAVALALIAIKLAAGLASHSLGLIAEAIHSATDLVAALMTFFALGVAVRPADSEHPFGHGKAEHLSALAEGMVLVFASVVIVVEAVRRLTGAGAEVQAGWYVLAVAGTAIVLDASRWLTSSRVARRELSAALEANALHFALDMVGSFAVLAGLLLVRSGHQGADSIAALLVAALVLVSAGRLMRRNVQVLMDSAPLGAERAARAAIGDVAGAVSVRRLRVRQSGGRHFADVVVAVEPGTSVAGGHAVANAVELAVEQALPGSDVVVHIEPDTASRLGATDTSSNRQPADNPERPPAPVASGASATVDTVTPPAGAASRPGDGRETESTREVPESTREVSHSGGAPRSEEETLRLAVKVAQPIDPAEAAQVAAEIEAILRARLPGVVTVALEPNSSHPTRSRPQRP